ncbi:hypothetical protein BAU15_12855 [Enterococcus sp. JM4C]|uniref:MucBP domain-containing protein n=1 Tax=Candidatus Enterococcus huntleyi TaxID=1857217 RepID=UPI00137B3556|nr:MucBP domain-containing protein [Enterococcus sp. JM4C]KAF1296439.1 hypothetical protein BAU15_12855 [Enterococcus sp. JM4C]
MDSRKNYKKMLAKKARQRATTKGAILAAFGLATVASTVPVVASSWKANTPESIQIKETDTSYTMVYGDTLWAISIRININVQTLAAINDIDLAAGEEYHLAVGTVIRWDKSGNITAETPTGEKINAGVKVNDSNKVVAEKPIGTDVTADVKDNKVSDVQINGKPDNVNTDKSNDSVTPGKDKDKSTGSSSTDKNKDSSTDSSTPDSSIDSSADSSSSDKDKDGSTNSSTSDSSKDNPADSSSSDKDKDGSTDSSTSDSSKDGSTDSSTSDSSKDGSTDSSTSDSSKDGSTDSSTSDSSKDGSTDSSTSDSSKDGSTDSSTSDSSKDGSTDSSTSDSSIDSSTDSSTSDSSKDSSTDSSTSDSSKDSSTDSSTSDSSKDGSTDSSTSDSSKDGSTDSSTPDKDGIFSTKLWDGTHIFIGPFNSFEEADEYITEDDYSAISTIGGYYFDDRDREPDVDILYKEVSSKFPKEIKEDKFYIYALLEYKYSGGRPTTDPITNEPTDKWISLQFIITVEEELIGPFTSYEDAAQFSSAFREGKAEVSSGRDFSAHHAMFPGGVEEDKWYLSVPHIPNFSSEQPDPEETKPSESTDSSESGSTTETTEPSESDSTIETTEPSESDSTTESTDSSESTTEPTQPGTDSTGTTDSSQPNATTGMVTVRYVNEYGEEIKTPIVMSGPIGETFNAVAPSTIGNFAFNINELPAGALVSGDSLLFINEYTAEPQTITFSYYYEGE